MTTVVNLFGGPGTGKSTTAAHLFAQLKQRNINCELVREYAKDVVWEGRISLLENQVYIFAKQLKRQVDLVGKVDVIVTDSPLLLSMVYNDDPDLHALVLKEYNKFTNVNVMLGREKPYQPAGRVQTEDEARGLDDTIRRMLTKWDIQHVDIPADLDAATRIRRELLGIND